MTTFWSPPLATPGEAMAYTPARTVPDRQGPTLYPDTYGGWPPCRACFRTGRLLDSVTDVCDPCAAARDAGRPVDLPTGAELEQVWRTLARHSVNEEVPDELVDLALATLAPGLEDADEALGELEDALLFQQEVNEPGFELASVAPEERNEDWLIRRAATRVDEALAVLVGDAR